jgi:hypothetical protein
VGDIYKMNSVIKNLSIFFFFIISSISWAQTDSTVLSHVEGPIGIQPLRNPDLDLVHGILSSHRLKDDFEKRVSDELNRLNILGYKTDVENIKVKTYVSKNKIYTISSCDIVKSKDGRSYVVFTTRGSIGKGYSKRHDRQVNGLEPWLQFYYRGYCKKVKTMVVGFKFRGGRIYYKQSFFVVARGF